MLRRKIFFEYVSFSSESLRVWLIFFPIMHQRQFHCIALLKLLNDTQAFMIHASVCLLANKRRIFIRRMCGIYQNEFLCSSTSKQIISYNWKNIINLIIQCQFSVPVQPLAVSWSLYFFYCQISNEKKTYSTPDGRCDKVKKSQLDLRENEWFVFYFAKGRRDLNCSLISHLKSVMWMLGCPLSRYVAGSQISVFIIVSVPLKEDMTWFYFFLKQLRCLDPQQVPICDSFKNVRFSLSHSFWITEPYCNEDCLLFIPGKKFPE